MARRSLLLLVFWAFLTSPLTSFAQAPDPRRKDLDEASRTFGRGEYEKARKQLRAIYESDQYSPEQRSKAGYLIGESLERVSQYKEAMAWYQRFLKDHPTSKNAVHARARLKSLKKNEGRFEKIILGEKAWDLYTEGKYSETLKILAPLNLPKTLEETKQRPVTEDDVQFFLIMGHCLRDLERYREAADAYEIAVSLDSYDAEEFRDRSLRYIVRERIFWASLLSLGLVLVVLFQSRPWRHWDRSLTKKVLVTALTWGVAGVSFWLVGANMEVSEDVEKPIFATDLVVITGLLFLPILASMLYGTAMQKSRRRWILIRVSLFSLSSCLATVGVILHFKDWFMLLSL